GHGHRLHRRALRPPGPVAGGPGRGRPHHRPHLGRRPGVVALGGSRALAAGLRGACWTGGCPPGGPVQTGKSQFKVNKGNMHLDVFDTNVVKTAAAGSSGACATPWISPTGPATRLLT